VVVNALVRLASRDERLTLYDPNQLTASADTVMLGTGEEGGQSQKPASENWRGIALRQRRGKWPRHDRAGFELGELRIIVEQLHLSALEIDGVKAQIDIDRISELIAKACLLPI